MAIEMSTDCVCEVIMDIIVLAQACNHSVFHGEKRDRTERRKKIK